MYRTNEALRQRAAMQCAPPPSPGRRSTEIRKPPNSTRRRASRRCPCRRRLRQPCTRAQRLEPDNLEARGSLPGSNQPEPRRSEEHTSELQSLMRISYAVFCLKQTTNKKKSNPTTPIQ